MSIIGPRPGDVESKDTYFEDEKNDYAHEHYLSHLYLNQMFDDKKEKLSI